ncbi:hypothetical protein OE88DRAFT_1658283 [Heliocybe sulcata]|uniref:Mus7/MMS22 family-domain-containing protein n=1 Tax=Heliocybe sulcata TaxID=5364 RepID=A0A5C3N2T2_9AGAM|nr:hypothetical protein OE88DRAFT_1658283 [Heliocybe sulcata]
MASSETEIVETSDVEERELLDAERPDYWHPAVTGYEGASPLPLSSQEKVTAADHAFPYAQFLPREAESHTPPRKRIKLTHIEDQEIVALSPRSLTLCNGSSRSVSRCPEINEIPLGDEESQLQFLDLPAPGTPALSQDTLAADVEHDGDGIIELKPIQWSHPGTPLQSLQPHDDAHGSPDPLYLSTPPYPAIATPAQPGEAPVMPDLPIHRQSGSRSPLFTPTSQRIYPSSPLAPLRSMRSRSPSHSSTHPNITPQQDSTSSRSVADIQIPTELLADDQFYRKYSLRTRQAKQLNPYAYDQATYRRLLRGNPDAIVKVVSPEHEKRRHHHHQHGQDLDRLIRSRSRSKDVSPTRRRTKPRKSVERESTGPGRRRSVERDKRPSTENVIRLNPTIPQSSDERWYPEILRQSFSSDEDELQLPAPPSSSRTKRSGSRSSENKGEDLRMPSPIRAPTPSFMKSPSARLQVRNSPPASFLAATPPLKKAQARRRQTPSPTPSSPGPGGYNLDGDFDVDIAPVPGISPSPSPGVRRDSPAASDSEESDHGSDSSDELSKQDRKRMKILGRMMPAFMINRTIKKGQRPTRVRSARSSDDGSASEQGVVPGRSKARIVRDCGRPRAEVVGDLDSSDPESILKSSDEEDEPVLIPPPRSPRPGRWSHSPRPGYDRQSLDTEEERQSDAFYSPAEDDVEEADIDSWLNIATASPRKRRGRREGDLIDWMLTKTRHVDGDKRRKSRGKRRSGHHSKPLHNAAPRLNVVAAGAKKYGGGRQTLLDFSKADHHAHPARQSSLSRHEEADKRMAVDEDVTNQVAHRNSTKAGERMRRRKAQKPQVYVLSNPGRQIKSGKRQTHLITLDLEDEDFRQALAPRPVSQAHEPRGPRPKLAPRTRAASGVAFALESDEEDYHMPRGMPGRTPDPPELVLRDIKSDCNVPFLPSGVTFGPRTYIGRGWLYELTKVLSNPHEASRPMAYTAYDIDLSPSLTREELVKLLSGICDLCFLHATAPPTEDSAKEERAKWEVFMHVVCQMLSWLFKDAELTEQDALILSDAREEIAKLSERLEEHAITTSDSLEKSGFWAAYWFCVEAFARLAVLAKNDDFTYFMKYSARLLKQLRRYGMQQTIDPLLTLDKPLDDGDACIRTAEVWVSLFHTCNAMATLATGGPPPRESHPFSRVVMGAIQGGQHEPHSDLEISEDMWKTIFTVSALSQFSVHGMVTSTPRLPAAWELVELALKRIRLTAEPDSAEVLSKRSLSKRDGYVRLVVSRCFVLWKRWHWRLDNALQIFNHLVEIFKSRKFTNLLDERPDFPNFLRRTNLQLLSECSNGDTAFTIFLKLIVQTVSDLRACSESSGKDTSVPKLKKLLSLAVPVGSVPFTKATPPMGQELSMLYNRYSAIAIAIYLDPTPGNIRYRLSQAQRYVVFKDADFATRMACIRGVMHLAMLIRHLQTSVDLMKQWLAEITNILVDECTVVSIGEHVGDARNRLLSIQLLLGSVRRVIETPNMDPSRTEAVYPDPGLLEGPWVTRVFAASTNLANVASTGIEIRKLVQAFLDARTAVMPKPRISRPAPANPGVFQEDSQDNYGDFDLDMDDPELLEALGENSGASLQKEVNAKDEVVCKVIDQHISPAIYRLVCKNVGDPTLEHASEEVWADIDKWIDCWVGCAGVTVINGRREWSHYLLMGAQSWERIIEASARRRVGLRFMYIVLQSDPSAYSTYQDRFLEVFFESLVTSKVSIENRYVALVLALDGPRHLLLRDAPWGASNDGELSVPAFMSGRLQFLRAVFANLSRALREQKDLQSREQTQSSMELIVSMLATMRDTYQSGHMGTYRDFCSSVFGFLEEDATLTGHPRLAPFVEWAKKTAILH